MDSFFKWNDVNTLNPPSFINKNKDGENMYKLMIKTHNTTGLKYLCMTKQKNHIKYNGSGQYWLKHLKVHGEDISTEIIFETENHNELRERGKYYSDLWDVVNSDQWANLRPEEGTGGDTVSNKFWITNGVIDRYINRGDDIPIEWRKGRSTGGFVDKNIQKELSKRGHNSEKYKEAMKDPAVREKISNSKKGKPNFLNRGNLNPATRPEVREKMSNTAKLRPMIKCDICGKEGQKSPGMFAFHFKNCKYNDNNKTDEKE